MIDQSLTLPNGQVIKNRIGKSALSETLATNDNKITSLLPNLYAAWAKGGAGLVVTGNVMIDKQHLGEPGNVVLEDESDLKMLTAWAKAGKQNGTTLWMQLNHPGKQSPVNLNKTPVAPSAIGFENKSMKAFFAKPRELTHEEILDLIQRYANAARIAEKSGFDGVQIHGAHGYLVSQFLSPYHNQRTDQWGGSAENRLRFVVEIYQAIRQQTSPDFAVGIKMNSADFQKGGFTEDESMNVAITLAELGIDLIEISGGNYENPVLMTGKESTRKREAYFLDFAEKIRDKVSTPLMVTGGFRSSMAMREALDSGACDMVGMGRPMAFEPDFAQKVINDPQAKSEIKPVNTGIKAIDDMAIMEIQWYTKQLKRIGQGKSPKAINSFFALIGWLIESNIRAIKTKRLRAS